MVGHTHEDIGQMFSCFFLDLTKWEASTSAELFAGMKNVIQLNHSVKE